MNTLSIRTRRDPFADFDALLRDTFGSGRVPMGFRAGFTPAAETSREGEDAVVRLELPGLDLDSDVTVEVEDGRLVVRGERRDERTEEQDGRSLREFRYGSFRRSFGLPAGVTADAISASYDAGVLSVRIAGAYAGTTPRRIEVSGLAAGEQTDRASNGAAQTE